MARTLQIVLGNQLFPLAHLPAPETTVVFMAEDESLCRYVRHHKQKLVLFLAAMRNYADALVQQGYAVCYHRLDDSSNDSYEDKLELCLSSSGADRVRRFEIEDKFMEDRIDRWAAARGVATDVVPSPMFLCERERARALLTGDERPRLADFYRHERVRLGLLLEPDGAPRGGQWSFDAQNRRKLPASMEPPELLALGPQAHVEAVTALVDERFSAHPGEAGPFWLPVTREAALVWLEDFLVQRFERFGPYEDAISRRARTLFHSVLSPVLNLGLLTPSEVVERLVAYADDHGIPLNSVEGIVRQIVGWREFVRGIYQAFSERQQSANFWGHERTLTPSWYAGTTGLPPLDDAIEKARRFGWDHHISRLMVVGNLMTLCEIVPQQAHRWFMEMYVDSSDWVMGPNVYGMALFSDGGLFATKPYICGSNYLLKMSDYPRGPWCDVVDGLYWRFIHRHRSYFASQPRLSMMPRMLERLDSSRRARLFATAEAFLQQHAPRAADSACDSSSARRSRGGVPA